MKKILTLILICATLCCTAQQSLIQVNGWNAYVHLPSDYTTNTTATFPTIIFFPGVGEVGTNAANVIKYGPGAYIAQGWTGNIVNSAGTTVEFIVISLQPPAAYPAENLINPAIAALKAKYRIDPKNLFLTGLSEGGWCASTFVSGDPAGTTTYSSQVKAICTVEGVKPDDNSPYPQDFSNFTKAGGKDLIFEQYFDARDGGTITNYMNSVVAGSSQFIQTNVGSGTHCCWDYFYGGNGAIPATSFTISTTSTPVYISGVQQNIYQWFASLVSGSTVVTPPVVVPPVVTPPVKQVIGTIILYSDSTYRLQ